MASPQWRSMDSMLRTSGVRSERLRRAWATPMMPFSGVRISWLVLARNSVRAATARSRDWLASSSRRLASWAK